MSRTAQFYLNQIDEATTIDQLDYLIEDAAEKIEDNSEYTTVYEKAFEKMQKWNF